MPARGGAPVAPHDAARRAADRAAFMALGVYERHRRLLADRAQYYGTSGHGTVGDGGTGAATTMLPRTDAEALAAAHEFIRDDAADAAKAGDWEVALARRYYAALYREYAVADLSRWRSGAVGLRWRTRAEVVAGTGQFSCGTLGCDERAELATLEVPFAYNERGQRKAAAVKLRLCPLHERQLTYTRQRGDGVKEGRSGDEHENARESRGHGHDARERRERSMPEDDDDGRSSRRRRRRSNVSPTRSKSDKKRRKDYDRERSRSRSREHRSRRDRSPSPEHQSPGRWGDDDGQSQNTKDEEFERFLRELMPGAA